MGLTAAGAMAGDVKGREHEAFEEEKEGRGDNKSKKLPMSCFPTI